MDAHDFEAERPRLSAVAGRILGSRADAEDVVQEAWLRLSRAEGVENVPAWLTTVVTRLCLDRLRQQRTRADVEVALAVAAPTGDAVADPEADSLLAERVGDAMQVVLDTLAPAERAAFVLHDVFAYPFEDIGAALGRSVTGVRQLASRARRKVQGEPETATTRAASAERERVVGAFLRAARGADMATLVSLLAPEAAMRADAAAQAMGARAIYDGASAVAERMNGSRGAAPVTLDGELGAAWIQGGTVKVAFLFHVDGGVICEIEQIGDPEVLASLDVRRVRARTP